VSAGNLQATHQKHTADEDFCAAGHLNLSDLIDGQTQDQNVGQDIRDAVSPEEGLRVHTLGFDRKIPKSMDRSTREDSHEEKRDSPHNHKDGNARSRDVHEPAGKDLSVEEEDGDFDQRERNAVEEFADIAQEEEFTNTGHSDDLYMLS